MIASVAEYVVGKISRPAFLNQVRETAAYLRSRLEDLRPACPEITALRGRGLMVGLDLSLPAQAVVAACAEAGLLVGRAGDSTLRLLPPLIVEKPHVDEAVRLLKRAIHTVRDNHVEKS